MYIARDMKRWITIFPAVSNCFCLKEKNMSDNQKLINNKMNNNVQSIKNTDTTLIKTLSYKCSSPPIKAFTAMAPFCCFLLLLNAYDALAAGDVVPTCFSLVWIFRRMR